MRHPAIALATLLLFRVWFSSCHGDSGLGVRFKSSDRRFDAKDPPSSWTSSRITLPPPPPLPPIRTTPCPVLPVRIEQCRQQMANEILNLTGTGMTRIGQAFVQSKNVKEVYLDDNEIADISPMAFDELPRLEVLSLRGNNISVARMLWFREHPALSRLIIDDNRRKDEPMIIREILHPLTRLKQLFLRRSNIDGLAVELKVFAPRLELLDVSGNSISSIDFLENAPKTLVDLRLDDNRIQTVDQDILSNVEMLSVSGNRITEVCGTATCSDSSFSLAGMTKLNKLNASRNSITAVAADAFEDATGLAVLDLSNNKIATLPSNAFNGLQAMNELRLNRNKLTTVPNLCALQRLRQLDLSHNHIAEVTGKGLCDLPSLETVLLAGNHILNVDQQVFLKLQMLRTLDLSGNAIDVLPIDLIAKARSLEALSLRNNSIVNIDELFVGRSNTLKELHLEDNPLPFIRAACMPHVTVHLKHISVDYEEMYGDEDYS